MNTNNFDQSSTGINLEVRAFYDTDLARINFDDELEIIQCKSYRSHTIALLKDGSNDGFSFTDLDNYKYTLKQIKTLLRKENTLEDLNYECYRILGYNFNAIVKADIQDFLSNFFDNSDLKDWLLDNLEPKFQIIETRGYCQGDYAEVVVTDLDYTDKGYIHNLFWDCPVYARLAINDDEYYLDELLNDAYEWDKDLVIEKFEKAHSNLNNLDLILEFLDDNLPENLDYF